MSTKKHHLPTWNEKTHVIHTNTSHRRAPNRVTSSKLPPKTKSHLCHTPSLSSKQPLKRSHQINIAPHRPSPNKIGVTPHRPPRPHHIYVVVHQDLGQATYAIKIRLAPHTTCPVEIQHPCFSFWDFIKGFVVIQFMLLSMVLG